MANGAWKIARGRGNAQLPLVIVVALAVVLVLLGKAQSGLFDKARVHVTDWMAPMLERGARPGRRIRPLDGFHRRNFSVYEQNLKLKQENARLRQWRNAEIVLEGRIKHYQALLHAVPDPKLNAVLARVIGRASRPFLQTMILDAGTASNAKAGQAVVDASGMIGRIYIAGQRTSWVILLTDLNSRIPVTIAPGNVQAILAGDNSAMPLLDQVARTTSLKAGDQVISSGDGGLLPQGLPIGSVVADGKGGYRVALLADASQTQDVEILNFANPPRAIAAQRPASCRGRRPQAGGAAPASTGCGTCPAGGRPPSPGTANMLTPAKPGTPPASGAAKPAAPANVQASAGTAQARHPQDRGAQARGTGAGTAGRFRYLGGAVTMAFAERTGSVAALKVFVRFLPFLCGLTCAFISNIPVSLTGGALPPPLLALVPIYFWCLVRPDLMTPTTAFGHRHRRGCAVGRGAGTVDPVLRAHLCRGGAQPGFLCRPVGGSGRCWAFRWRR